MDIPGLSMALAQSNLSTDWGMGMLSKSMDNAEQVGAAITEMIDAAAMERSVNPAVGGNIDIRL